MSVSKGVVTNSFGQQVGTARVQHAVESRYKLEITLKNNTANDLNNVTIFPGFDGKDLMTSKNIAGAAAQGVDVVMTINGTTFDRYCKYYSTAKVAIEGAQVWTDNTANYVGHFVHEETYPSFDKKDAKEDISGFRVNLTNGWAEDMEIPPSHLVWRLWQGLTVAFSRLKANSTMKFEFNVVGVDKSMEASGIAASVIN